MQNANKARKSQNTVLVSIEPLTPVHLHWRPRLLRRHFYRELPRRRGGDPAVKKRLDYRICSLGPRALALRLHLILRESAVLVWWVLLEMGMLLPPNGLIISSVMALAAHRATPQAPGI